MVSCGVPLLFLIYINNLNEAISYSLIHHFADNTNILFSNKSLKKIHKYINHDLTQIAQWLKANRISLRSNKTEIILFRPKNKKTSKKLNFRVSDQKLEPLKQNKYLNIYLDGNMTWNFEISQINSKLSRSSGLLAKLR